MESIFKGIFLEIIVYIQYNQIVDDWWNVWTGTGGWGILEKYSVEFDCRDKSDLNETTDQ